MRRCSLSLVGRSVCSSRASPREAVLLTVPREHSKCGRNLGFGKVQEVTQDEHRTLTRRERTERGVELVVALKRAGGRRGVAGAAFAQLGPMS